MNTKLKHLQIGDLTARLPIIQGGMGVGVSLSKLAGAVAKEGGVGIISTAQIGYDEKGFETITSCLIFLSRKASRKIRQDVIVLLYGNIFKKQKKSPVATDLSE